MKIPQFFSRLKTFIRFLITLLLATNTAAYASSYVKSPEANNTPYLVSLGVLATMGTYYAWPSSSITHVNFKTANADPVFTAPTWVVEKIPTQQHPTLGWQREEFDTYRITLDDGFIVELNNKDATWTIKLKKRDGSETFTRIFGDPHVQTSQHQSSFTHSLDYIWEFNKDITLILENGTKIHTFLKDKGRNLRQPHTEELVIIRGNQSLKVTGISEDNPKPGQVLLKNRDPLQGKKTNLNLYMVNNSADAFACAYGDENCASLYRSALNYHRKPHDKQ